MTDEYETISSEPFGEFYAMAQGRYDYTIKGICIETPKYDKMLAILASEGVIYITREQAISFFGLIDNQHHE